MYSTRNVFVLTLINLVLSDKSCYWNEECPFGLYSTKTPYDTVRGDIRDWPLPENCEAISFWALIRHGNRNPSDSVTSAMKELQAKIKDQIIASYEAGTSQLCAQEIQEFRKFVWNDTMDTSPSYLTGEGYEEIYDMAMRIREKYPQLLSGSEDQYYFRPSDKQRTIASAMAYVHALSEGTELNLTADSSRERDDVLRPYDYCERYQEEVRGGQLLVDQLEAYFNTQEYKAVQQAVQQRLGIPYQLTAADVYNLQELCRFYRSWTPNLKSPWCAPFSHEDLLVLEYRDDVRHYYRNGYSSWMNANLGRPVLKDLYETFDAAVSGAGKKIVSYFAHDTLMEMVYCALGMYKDAEGITAQVRNPNRMWRTTYIAPFSANIMAVLNRCQESGTQVHRVQIFNNEKVTPLCPLQGCTWEQFISMFETFKDAPLDFCRHDYRFPELVPTPSPASAGTIRVMMGLVLLLVSLAILHR
ncbi:multiple inositol polyphosphate phosphatase 1-like [Colias croceus]|uniref:multiple inositol polyphosphate phosphatase 1-like n=1 Tax=Colias crocea TaxID=72248 RepID=UPI001E27FB30|nr:multiple inositol polyphosphate phosphatase 1-like [Colias croceus]